MKHAAENSHGATVENQPSSGGVELREEETIASAEG